jgi:trigger factor
MDINTFKAQFKEQAEERVRVQLTMEKLAEVENIEVSKEDIDNKINEMAKNYGEREEMFRNSLKEDDI